MARPAARPSGASPAHILRIRRAIQPQRDALLGHPVFDRLRSRRALQRFCELHCFAVWDFMCLAKTLQRRLTCVDVPWLPPVDPEAARSINEMILVEESDALPDGQGFGSHYELYLAAMKEIGADTRPITGFLERLRQGAPCRSALEESGAHPGAVSFVTQTLATCANGLTHEVAASFVFGRENLIPDLFRRMVTELGRNDRVSSQTLLFYLERHVQVDGQEHGPAAERLIASLCGSDERRWDEAEKAATAALDGRLALWNAIAASL